jgi:hypothetical protein
MAVGAPASRTRALKAVWTRTAIRDLSNAKEYNPRAAREIALKIMDELH